MQHFACRSRGSFPPSICLVARLRKHFMPLKRSRQLDAWTLQTSERFYSSRTNSTKSFALCRLHSRSLLRLAGSEVDDFLQGIITNDIRLLAGSRCEHPVKLTSSPNELMPSLYSLCLNVQGRVLFDVILHRLQLSNPDNLELALEHDAAILASIRNHLRMYKLRRSIDVDDEYGNRMHVWALIQQNETHHEALHIDSLVQHIAETLRRTNDGLEANLFVGRDPRPVKGLGFRLLIPSNVDVIKSLQSNGAIVDDCELNISELMYQQVLYQNGVGEGSQDLLPGKSFPLECNADYLHGVSFEKGCYIGQELTARTFHTGVVRKRLMPISFTSRDVPLTNEKENSGVKVIVDSSVTTMDEAGGEKVLGKVRNAAGSSGIALLRIDGALAAKKLEVQLSDGKKYAVNVSRPPWWPKQVENNMAAQNDVEKNGAAASRVSP